MNIRNKKLPLTLLLSCLIPGVAKAEPQLFGQANLSIASLDDDTGNSTSVASHSSRVGVQGNIESKSSLEVGYRFVWQIDMADEAASSNDHIKSREQYISLKDNWGEVRIGRHDTPYKKAGKKSVEFFSDSYADWNNIITKTHDVRSDSSISYYKALGAANFSVMYAGGEDTPAGDNAGEIFSGAVEVKTGDLVLAFAYQDIAEVPAPLPVAPATNAAKGVVGYTLGGTSVGFAIERVDTTGSPHLTNTMLSVKHKLNEDNTVKFAFGEAEDPASGIDDPTMIALGLDHKLSTNTTAFVYWADGDNGGLANDAKLVGDSRVIAVGAIVKF